MKLWEVRWEVGYNENFMKSRLDARHDSSRQSNQYCWADQKWINFSPPWSEIEEERCPVLPRPDSSWEILIVYKLQTRNANFRLNLLAGTMLLISRSLDLFQDWVWEPLGKMLINKWLLIILIVWTWPKYSIKDRGEGGLLKDYKAKELFWLQAI